MSINTKIVQQRYTECLYMRQNITCVYRWYVSRGKKIYARKSLMKNMYVNEQNVKKQYDTENDDDNGSYI